MPSQRESFSIATCSHDFNGIAKRNKKTCFINDSLPGERVQARLLEQKRKFERWQLEDVLEPHPQRIEPKCTYYSQCGGCDFQHASQPLQQQLKAEKVQEQVQRMANTQALTVLPSLVGQGWHYRRKARLATWFNRSLGYYELGFRAAGEKRLVAIEHCLVLEPQLDALLKPLQGLLKQLAKQWRLGHIDLLLGDDLSGAKQAFVIVRVMDRSSDKLQDHEPEVLALLQAFQSTWQCEVLLQLDPVDDQAVFYPVVTQASAPHFSYSLPQFKLQLSCAFEDFLQANAMLNRQMVAQTIALLELEAGDSVAEFFAGMGNFSLALAQSVERLQCFEGSAVLVDRLVQNAKSNALENITAKVQNLMAEDLDLQAMLADVDKVLLDPPRDGAQILCQQLMHKGKKARVKRIVYISCNPSSLARDAALLCEKAYKLTHLGLIDLFSQTRHMEAIAVFEAKK